MPNHSIEYTEAGAFCRSYELHTRTAVSLFVPFSTATIAYVYEASNSLSANITLCVLGMIFGVVTLIVIYRTREFYHIAHTRAKALEAELGFELHGTINGRFRDSCFIPSIKIIYMLVVFCFLVAFGMALHWALGQAGQC